MKISKAKSQQFVDMLNDYAADERIDIPGISLEEARTTEREPMNRRIRAVLLAVVAHFPEGEKL